MKRLSGFLELFYTSKFAIGFRVGRTGARLAECEVGTRLAMRIIVAKKRLIVVLWHTHGIVQSSIGRLGGTLTIRRTRCVDIVVMVNRVIMDTVVASIVLDQGIGKMWWHVVFVAAM